MMRSAKRLPEIPYYRLGEACQNATKTLDLVLRDILDFLSGNDFKPKEMASLAKRVRKAMGMPKDYKP